MSQPSHDTQACPTMQPPAGLEEQARLLKAYQRQRGIERASDLLRALLAWVLGGCSFRQLGCWAVLLGVADISETAWRKRVRRCGDWLQWLLMAEPRRKRKKPGRKTLPATGDPGGRHEPRANRRERR